VALVGRCSHSWRGSPHLNVFAAVVFTRSPPRLRRGRGRRGTCTGSPSPRRPLLPPAPFVLPLLFLLPRRDVRADELDFLASVSDGSREDVRRDRVARPADHGQRVRVRGGLGGRRVASTGRSCPLWGATHYRTSLPTPPLSRRTPCDLRERPATGEVPGCRTYGARQATTVVRVATVPSGQLLSQPGHRPVAGYVRPKKFAPAATIDGPAMFRGSSFGGH
jgi:hypothetical protein